MTTSHCIIDKFFSCSVYKEKVAINKKIIILNLSSYQREVYDLSVDAYEHFAFYYFTGLPELHVGLH